MLEIRPDQVLAFTPQLDAQADRDLAVYLSRRFPVLYPDPVAPPALAACQAARAQARGLGLSRENDVATCLDFTVMYGPGWPGHAWAADALACPRLHAPDQMTILRGRVEDAGVPMGAGGGPS